MLVGISAYADGTESGLTWSLSDGVLTISGNGAIPDYSYTSTAPWHEAEIHSVIIENGVTRVGAWAFDHCSAESISLPETLTSIGDYSFRCNNSLQNIDIPYGVTEIGTWAFEQCQALESISFPDTLVSIGQSAFYKCAKLQSVVIPASVTVLQNNLFNECWRLKSVTFSSDVTAIEGNAFAYCSWLDEVFFKGSAADWAGLTIGEGNASLTNALRHYVYNENLSWTLVDGILTITGTGLMPTFSDDAPWVGTEFTSAVIEEGITSVSSFAFHNCIGMQSISLPDSLTKIDTSAFRSCSALTEVTLPDSVTTLGTSVFTGCSSLSQVTFGAGLSSIGDTLFNGCSSLDAIYCNENNTKYTSVNGVLFNKHKTSLILFPTGYSGSYRIPIGTTSIGQSAFYRATKVTVITIPEGVTTINMMGFDGCSALTSVELPSSLKTMGSFAFAECSDLTEVTIREGLQTIPSGAFTGCKKLVNVWLPISLRSISASAFSSNCTSLNTVYYAGNETEWSAISISSDNDKLKNASLNYGCVPPQNPVIVAYGNHGSNISWTLDENGLLVISGAGDMEDFYSSGTYDWRATDVSSAVKSVIIDDRITSIGEYAFNGFSNLEQVVMANTVTLISNRAFYDCTSLTGVTLSNQLISIGNSAFYRCNQLSKIAFPETLESIGDYAFYICRKMTKADLPEGLATIGNHAFDSCEMLGQLVIPSTVTTIGNYAFDGCHAIKTLTIPSTVTTLGEYVFSNCVKLESAVIEEGMTSLPAGTFNNCYALESVQLPSTLMSIGSYAFNTGYYEMDYPMTSIVIPDGVTEIGAYAFNCQTGLTSIHLPANLHTLGNKAFSYCLSLTEVDIPDGTTTIGANTFYGDSALTRITIPRSVTTIGTVALGDCTNVTVYCYEGSTAHTYAVNNNIPFVLLDEEAEGIGVPTNIHWVEGSTATAAWDAVDGANYYLVDVKVTLNDELIGETQTGTADTEIDVQQEIHDILEETQRESEVYVMVSFAVTAQKEEGESVTQGEKSLYSDELFFRLREDDIVAPAAPINLVLNENLGLMFYFDYSGPFIQYVEMYEIRVRADDEEERWAYGNNEYGKTIAEIIEERYGESDLAGREVLVDVRVQIECRYPTNEMPGSFVAYTTELSEYSNAVEYTIPQTGQEEINVPDAPVNLVLDENLGLTFDFDYSGPFMQYVEMYEISVIAMDGQEMSLSGNSEYGNSVSGIVQEYYLGAGLLGTTITISVRVQVDCRYPTNEMPGSYVSYNTEWSEYCKLFFFDNCSACGC